MSDVFFIGDTHFGHKNILEYEPVARPFRTLGEMHDIMIERWNKTVKKHDKVYHLGDFAFGRDNISIASKLNGQKRLILGNHDAYPADMYLKYFCSVHGALFWKNFILTHIPVHSDMLQGRADFNIHGHLHSKNLDDKRYINVSCEQNNLTPIHLDQILERTC